MLKLSLEWIDRLTTVAFSITLGFTFCGLFLLPNGKTILSNLLVISILFGMLNVLLGKNINIGLIDRRILWVFISYALFILFNRLVHGDQYGVMRGLIYVVTFGVLIPRKNIIILTTLYAILIGGIGLGAISLWQQFNGIDRVDGFTNAILYSQAALSLTLLNFWIYITNNDRVKKLLSILASTSALLALYASQSRGVWLALLLITMIFFMSKLIKKPLKYLAIGSISLILISISFQNSSILQNRINDSFSDMKNAENGQFETSWGLRIVAWQSAWLGFIDNPLLGVGADGFDKLKIKQAETYQVSPLILNPYLKHAHNQYMQNLVIRGFVGGIFIILILFIPFWFSFKKNGLLSIGSLIPISFSIYSLSDVPFEHQETLYLYTLIMLFIFYYNESNMKNNI